MRFERRYEASPEEVWSALTEPDSIRRWLFADAVLEPWVGGAFGLAWSGGERAGGSVRVWEPPRVLEVDWDHGELHTVLRIEVMAAESGAVLVLDHRNVTAKAALGIGPGWHAHLEGLGELLSGGSPSVERWRPRYESLRGTYEQLLSAVGEKRV